MLTISKHMGEFAAAHTLTAHDGGCANLHGHNYGVEVTLIGNFQNSTPDNPQSGMIIDFSRLKALYKEHIHDIVDHATIIGKNVPKWYMHFVNLQYDAMSREPIRMVEPSWEMAQRVIDTLLGKVVHLPIPETTAEYFAKWILETMDAKLSEDLKTMDSNFRLAANGKPTEIMVYSVSVWETLSSKATYVNPPLSPGLSTRFKEAL